MPAKPKAPAKRTGYAPHEIDKALTTLAYYGGNSIRASEATGISDSTLRDWRVSLHRDRYLEIAEREGPRLEALAANQARELIVRASATEHDLLSLLDERITEAGIPRPQASDYSDAYEYEIDLKAWQNRPDGKTLGEYAGALQRITTSKGINGTKLLELTGRPTSIVEHRDPKADGLALLRQLGIAAEIPASATSVPSPQPLATGSDMANVRKPRAKRKPKPAAD